MRIGIDATCWANDRGYGRFTRELVSAMVDLSPSDTFVCFLDERAAARFAMRQAHVETVVVGQSVSPTVAAQAGGGRSPMDMLRFSRAVGNARLDVFFSPSVYGYFPLPPSLPAVVTIHDAIAERFPELTLPTLKDRVFWRAKVALAVRQADLILTVSDHAAREITELIGVSPDRLRVSLEGVAAAYRPSESSTDIERTAARVGVPAGSRWLIYVGGFGPHKHVDVLVRAHAAVAARHTSPPLALVLVGPNRDVFHQDVAAIERAIDNAGTSALVRWAGYLDDEDIRHLHSGAVALVLVSAAEGFGLPAVEAARCGAPVIATTMSPLPDVLDGGGLFIPPNDQPALERAIETLVTSETDRRRMGARALERAAALSWPRSAGIALGALRDAVAMRHRKTA